MDLLCLYIRARRIAVFGVACGLMLFGAASSLVLGQTREDRVLTIEAYYTSEGTHVLIAESQLGTFVTRSNGDRLQIIIPNAANSTTPRNKAISKFFSLQIDRSDRDAVVTIELLNGAKASINHDSAKIDVMITPGTVAGGSDAGRTESKSPSLPSVLENAEHAVGVVAKSSTGVAPPVPQQGVLVPQPAIPRSSTSSLSQQNQQPRENTSIVEQKPTAAKTSASQQAADLHGTVTDQAGALIVGATVTLQGGHDHKYTAQTNGQGQYRFDGVAPDTYQVTIAATTFTPVTEQLDLTSRRSTPFDVELKVTISEQVEIRGNRSDSLSNMTLSGSDIEALPDDPRKMLMSLRQLARTMGGSMDMPITVNGFESGEVPPKDAIQMIRINTNEFAAEYTQRSGGGIDITTKPGSGRFHGGVTFDFNDESLNARNAFALTRAPLQNRSYGGQFGGPIIRNRWGFYAQVSHRAQDENSVINATILNPVTLLPQPLVTTVSTPSRSSGFQINTNFLATKRHTFGFDYNHASGKEQNQGVGKFDLPERAYLRSTLEDRLRFTLMSIYSDTVWNEMRVELARDKGQTRAISGAPAIIVLDTFNGGGNQAALFNTSSSNTLRSADNVGVISDKHALKFGFSADAVQLKNIDRSNFGGTFTYGTDFERDSSGAPLLDSSGQRIVITPLEHYRRTLLGLPGFRPSQFTIARGDPFIGFTQWDMAAFAQDDWRFLPRLALSYGLRYQFQTHLRDKMNLAPRLAFAWKPGKEDEGTLRGGVGVFYQAVGNDITFNTTKFDGQHQQELTVESPASAKIPEIINRVNAPLPTTQIKSPDLRTPYLIVSKIKYQHPLPWNLYGSVSYTWERGVHLLRLRNVNAPLPGAPSIHPLPGQGPRLQFESTGLSSNHALNLGLWGDINYKISMYASYTLAFANSDTDSAYTTPANSYDLSNEYGRVGQRHYFYIGGGVSLPWDVYMSTYMSASSGSPFNITTGLDNNGDTFFSDRPAFAKAGTPGAIVTPFGIFNPNPQPGNRIIPRNFGNGPGEITANVNFSKTLMTFGPSGSSKARGFGAVIHPPYKLTGTVDIQNLLNHTNFGGYNDVLTSPFFGRPNYANDGRRINLSMSFTF